MKYTLLAALLFTLTITAVAQTTPDLDCKVRVMVIKHNWEDAAKVERQTLSKHQAEWWKKNSKKFPGVCLVTEEPADYLLTWTETWTLVPYTTTAPVTTTHSGTVRTDTGRTATYEGTSTTYETRRQEWNHWWVDARLYRLDDGKPSTAHVFEAKHHGRWMWSKPDKDAFEKTIKHVRGLNKP